MSGPLQYGVPRDDREVADFHRVLTQSFGLSPDPSRSPALEEGLANLRLVRRTGRVVGGLAVHPCRQHFGGRPVPMGAVRSVASAPDVRGGGIATMLMAECLREHREKGWAVSTLFPSTRGLYRKVGYEVAGRHPTWRLALPLPDAPPAEHGVAMRPFDLGDARAMAAMRQLYERQAAETDGWIDRTDWFWARAFRQQPGDAASTLVYAYLIEGKLGPEGYVLYTQPAGGARRYRLRLRDWVATTPAARRRLLAFLGDHATLADAVDLHAAPHDPLLLVSDDPLATPVRDHFWMLRVVDVQAALEARGYAAGFAGELHLEVRDALFPQNEGPITLTVEAGRGAVRTGGRAHVGVEARGLAALYAGFLDPFALRGMGLLEGPDAELARLRAAFAGPTAWLPEMF